MSDLSHNQRSPLRYLLPVLVILLTILMIYGLSAFKPEAKKRPPRPEIALQVETVTARFSDFQIKMPSRGLVQAQTESTLAAEVSGTVVAISENLREGGRFKQGEWLLTIDPRDYEVEVKLAKARVRQAQLALDEEQARADQALRDWQRLSSTIKNKAVSEPPDLVLRKPQLAAAEAELDSTLAQLEKTKLDLDRTRILAPFDGLVLSQQVDLGHYVTPGNALADISGRVLEIALPVSASWRPLMNWQAIDRGASSQEQADTSKTVIEPNVILDVGEGAQRQSWPARIVRNGGQVLEQSRQMLLIAEILEEESLDSADNPWPLLPGDYASAQILAKELTDVVVLPRTALVEGAYLWQIVDGRLKKQTANVIWRDQESIVLAVNQQIQSGDEFVSTPMSYAVSGTRVNIIKRDGKPVSDVKGAQK